jgi:16S rRNA processing protein RimM
MNISELFQAGYITKIYGFKGELIAQLDDNIIIDEYLEKEPIFFIKENKPVPFKFSIINFRTDGKLRIKIQGIDSDAEAQQFLKTKIFFKKNKCKFNQQISDLDAIINYNVIDKKYGNIGKVEKYSIFPAQNIIHVSFNKKEILIPYIDELIEKIDDIEKIIYVNTPDGLIDMYCK